MQRVGATVARLGGIVRLLLLDGCHERRVEDLLMVLVQLLVELALLLLELLESGVHGGGWLLKVRPRGRLLIEVGSTQLACDVPELLLLLLELLKGRYVHAHVPLLTLDTALARALLAVLARCVAEGPNGLGFAVGLEQLLVA